MLKQPRGRKQRRKGKASKNPPTLNYNLTKAKNQQSGRTINYTSPRPKTIKKGNL